MTDTDQQLEQGRVVALKTSCLGEGSSLLPDHVVQWRRATNSTSATPPRHALEFVLPSEHPTSVAATDSATESI